MNIEKELTAITESTSGNRNIALFYDPVWIPHWEMHFKNDQPHKHLGDIPGKYVVKGNSLAEVIVLMKKQLKL